jgi:uncharacterized protein YjiS (DUF1127 family)
MTAITLTPAAATASPWRAVLATLNRLHRVHQEFQVRTELGRFTDRQLADLGLDRDDIPAVARGELRR